MRIISQEGCYDLPYEQTMLTNIGTKIYADNLAIKELRFAEYSTEEKAEKAMKMCRSQFAWCEIRNHGMNSLTMAMSSRKTDEIEQFLETFAEENIFRFPADEEIDGSMSVNDKWIPCSERLD